MYDKQANLKGRMHADPQTAAEHFALHLELNYGLQLDPARHQGLLLELEQFAFDAHRTELPYAVLGSERPGEIGELNRGVHGVVGFNRSDPALPYSDPGLAPNDPQPGPGNATVEEQNRLACGTPTDPARFD